MARFDVHTDYYDALGVPKTATQEVLEAAWKRRAFELHPDRAAARRAVAERDGQPTPDEAEITRRFALVRTAWDVLGNGTLRHDYDAARAWEADRPARERREREEREAWAAREAARRSREQERERERERERELERRVREHEAARRAADREARRQEARMGAAADHPDGGYYRPASQRDLYDFSVMSSRESALYHFALATLRRK